MSTTPHPDQSMREAAEKLSVHVQTSAFSRILSAHDGSPIKLQQAMVPHLLPGADLPPTQRLGAWRVRGWASPFHFAELLPLLPDGLTILDLYRDVHTARALAALAGIKQKQA
jgi:hypothetical protein